MKKLLLLIGLVVVACGAATIQNGSQAQLAEIEAECIPAVKEFCPVGEAGAGGAPSCEVRSVCADKLDAWEDAGAH